jgi:polyhydroxyalkanoic acid synthase PhaR subunit
LNKNDVSSTTNGGGCMFDNRSLDPYKVWREMYENSEKYWSQMFREAMLKDEYSKWMNSMLDANLFFNKFYQDATKVYSDSNQLLSKDDLANVAKLIVNVDDKLDKIEDLLDGGLNNNNQNNSSEIEGKVAKLEQKITSIEQAVIQLSQLTKIQTENVTLLNNLYTNRDVQE